MSGRRTWRFGASRRGPAARRRRCASTRVRSRSSLSWPDRHRGRRPAERLRLAGRIPVADRTGCRRRPQGDRQHAAASRSCPRRRPDRHRAQERLGRRAQDRRRSELAELAQIQSAQDHAGAARAGGKNPHPWIMGLRAGRRAQAGSGRHRRRRSRATADFAGPTSTTSCGRATSAISCSSASPPMCASNRRSATPIIASSFVFSLPTRTRNPVRPSSRTPRSTTWSGSSAG